MKGSNGKKKRSKEAFLLKVQQKKKNERDIFNEQNEKVNEIRLN